MADDKPQHWEKVRPLVHEYFRFWPDHEDLIWAKSVWPFMEDAGLFAEFGEEADSWTRRNIAALSVLYAESATRFGVDNYARDLPLLNNGWLTVTFGSAHNLDEHTGEVGKAIFWQFLRNRTFEGDSDFFLPLIRSLVCGSNYYYEGPGLDAFLKKVERNNFDITDFQVDELRRMWIGSNYSRSELQCIV